MRLAGGRQAVAKVRQPLLTQQEFAVRERAKHLLQMTLMVKIIFAHPRLAKQSVVQSAALGRQGDAALLYFAKARRMGASMLPGKHHRLFKGLKAGLAQQNRHIAARRAFY